MATSRHDGPDAGPGRAKTLGLAVAALGIVIFNIAPFLDWVKYTGDAGALGLSDESLKRTGYETDSLVPFMAYLGVGLLLAMAYAMTRARRGQHRGLTLVTMGVGLAATLQCIAFAVEPMGGLERGEDLAAQIGVYVGIVGASIWAIGCGLLAREIEGDDDRPGVVADTRGRQSL